MVHLLALRTGIDAKCLKVESVREGCIFATIVFVGVLALFGIGVLGVGVTLARSCMTTAERRLNSDGELMLDHVNIGDQLVLGYDTKRVHAVVTEVNRKMVRDSDSDSGSVVQSEFVVRFKRSETPRWFGKCEKKIKTQHSWR